MQLRVNTNFGNLLLSAPLVGFPTLWWMQRKIKTESRKALNKVAMAFLYDALQQV